MKISNWKTHIKNNNELNTAISILKKIENSSYQAYLVGGFVRDLILNNTSHDIDIATNMPMDQLSELFITHDIGQSRDFGIVVVKYNDYDFEVAQFRQDNNYDGRKPESVKLTNNFKDDVSRRDFTINALGVDSSGNVIDYFNGQQDIENKILRTVGNPYERFNEDFLRMLRLARFSAKLGFKIEKNTEMACKKLSSNVVNLAVERINDELHKAAAQSGKKFAKYIILLDKLKILRYILPEIVNLKWHKENFHHHPETRGHGGTVFSHTIAALKKSDAKDPIKNLAILCHDIGKGITLSHDNGLPKYLGHDKASAMLIDDIADRLKFSTKDRNALIFGTIHHMEFHNILEMRPSKIVKLVSDDNWHVLLSVAKADELSRGATFSHADSFDVIVNKVLEIKERFYNKRSKKIKLVDGNDVMKLTGLKPSPLIGKIIIETTDWIISNNVTDKNEIEKKIIELGKNLNIT